MSDYDKEFVLIAIKSETAKRIKLANEAKLKRDGYYHSGAVHALEAVSKLIERSSLPSPPKDGE
jgi:hypothetical protein